MKLEIVKINTQNGLQFGFDITDNIPPVIKELKVYSKAKNTVIDGDNDDKLYTVKGSAKNCYIDKTIESADHML